MWASHPHCVGVFWQRRCDVLQNVRRTFSFFHRKGYATIELTVLISVTIYAKIDGGGPRVFRA